MNLETQFGKMALVEGRGEAMRRAYWHACGHAGKTK